MKFSTLDPSQLKFVERACDLCGNKERQAVYSVPFLGLKFHFVRCPACGLVYQDPVLDKESLNSIYETLEYWEHKHKRSGSSAMLNYYSYVEGADERRQTANIRANWIAPYLPKDARLLDLGCSDGLFVDVLTRAGYKASGLDVSNVMVSRGRGAYKADIVRADFEGDWPFSETFDAITCYATLSNIVNPSRVFANVSKHLRPGGYFFFNFGCHDRLVSRFLRSRLYLYRPTACTIYSKNTIADYCAKNNLKIVRIFNDVQVVPMIRLFGFLRIPGLVGAFKRLGMEKLSIKMTLLTGYAACAVRDI